MTSETLISEANRTKSQAPRLNEGLLSIIQAASESPKAEENYQEIVKDSLESF